ncbi:Competence protein F homolog, phosphoribosyltransferase domain; protein YhgH required for utilization of DNA as sole source of carbon and energy [hydrothermal vent metagenome]|uniref:Competence protein F homolog, phosphoribosyltransferase domain protein YhgH required for utilization of DNA as sole source of carbon and energy n=1 Tax=hydrothermal vent metagenome TaxID=652676 RepID=A0A3B0QR30_9ZZZZ
MNNNARKLLGSFTDLIFPPLCPLCAKSKAITKDCLIVKDGLCLECQKGTRAITSPICSLCGTPLAGAGSVARCGACIKAEPPYKLARSAFHYDGPLLGAIHNFKYNGRTLLAPTLAALAARALDGITKDFDKIVPIPLHKNRLQRRGFNQSLLLARELLHSQRPLQNAGIDYRNLQRKRDTRSQIELKGRQRVANVKGAFSVIDKDAFKDKKVLLVDDVYTTGATIKECSRVLSACGAEVYALTLARVIRV